MALLGVDIGGTKIAIGLATDEGKLLDQDRFLVIDTKTPEAALDRVAEIGGDLLRRHQQTLTWVGIGSPGPFHDGRLAAPANLPGWDGIDLSKSLEARLGKPASLQNDATAAAIGEWMFGNGRGSRHVAYITVSTGVGAGLVLNGSAYGGPHGNAAEIGHIVIDPQGPQCNCGLRGCLEALASGTAIGKLGRERAQQSLYLSQFDVGSISAAIR